MFLIVIDAHSKWMQIEIVNSATSQTTIEYLRMIFTRFGLPELMITDNGTYFTSSEYQTCTHCPLPSIFKWPGRKEVETFKLGIGSNSLVRCKLNCHVFFFITGVTQAELLLTRKPRSHLPSVVSHASLQNSATTAAEAESSTWSIFKVSSF